MIPVAALASLPGFEPATVALERRGAPSSVDSYGAVVEPAATVISLQVVTHQATRRQLVRAQLDAATDWRAFYCATELRTRDVVPYGGERWELQNVADYGTLGGIWIALACRIE